MKKSILMLLLSLFGVVSFAQSRLNTDSLTAAIVRYSREDTVKVKMYCTLAELLIWKDPAKGAQVAEQGHQLANKLHKPLWAARALCAKANNKTGTGDLAEAFASLEQASSAITTQGTTTDAANLNLALAWCYSIKRVHDQATIYMDKAMVLFERINDLRGQANCQLIGCAIMSDKGQMDNLLICTNKALAKYEQIKDKLGIARANISLTAYFGQTNQYQQSVEHSHKVITIANTIDAPVLAARSYADIGNVFRLQSNLIQAINYYQKALKIAETLHLKDTEARIYDKIGLVHLDLKEYETAIPFFKKALDLNTASGNQMRIASTYSNLATVYQYQKNHTKSIEFQQKALAINIAMGNKYSERSSYMNLANTYIEQKDYTNAYEYYKRSMELSKATNNKQGEMGALNGLGVIYLDASDTLLIRIGMQPTNRNRTEKAIEMQLAAQALAEKSESSGDLCTIKHNISKIYEKMGDYANAYTYYNAYITMRDTIFSNEIKNKIVRKEMQYEYDKKEITLKYEQQLTTDQLEKQRLLTFQQAQTLTLKEQALALSNKDLLLSNNKAELAHLAYLKAQAEKQEQTQQLSLSQEREKGKARDLNLKNLELSAQQKQNLYLGLFAALLLGGLGALSYFYNTLRKQKNTNAAQAARLSLLIKELHHRVKNNLQVVSSLLSVQTDEMHDEAARKSINEGKLRVDAMSIIHQRLYLTDDITELNLEEYVNDLIQHLAYAYGYEAHDYTLHLSIKPEMYNVDDAIPIGLMLNEVLTNAFKYGFPNNPNPELWVNISNDKGLAINVRDNGTTPPTATVQGTGFGTKLIASLSYQLNANTSISYDKGYSFTLTANP